MLKYITLAIVFLSIKASYLTAASWSKYPDFATYNQVEKMISPSENHTPQSLSKLSQEQLDRLYARAQAGPIPEGRYKETVLISLTKGDGHRLSILSSSGENSKFKKQSTFEKLAKNLAFAYKVFPENSRKVFYNINSSGRRKYPGKLYCGQSKLDSRRESIILDYQYADDITYGPLPYEKSRDWFTTRHTAGLRSEMRMIHPGLYLGRTYARDFFIANFILSGPSAAKGARKGPCWRGTQDVEGLVGGPELY